MMLLRVKKKKDKEIYFIHQIIPIFFMRVKLFVFRLKETMYNVNERFFPPKKIESLPLYNDVSNLQFTLHIK